MGQGHKIWKLKESWNKIKFYGFKGPLEMAMSGAVSRLGVWGLNIQMIMSKVGKTGLKGFKWECLR